MNSNYILNKNKFYVKKENDIDDDDTEDDDINNNDNDNIDNNTDNTNDTDNNDDDNVDDNIDDNIDDNNDDNIYDNIDDKPPIYDGEEDLYLFNRKWEIYLKKKTISKKYNSILKFLNLLFNKKFTKLSDIKEIKKENIPDQKKFVKLMLKHPEISEQFNINYSNTNYTTIKLIDKLLSKIKYSFVEIKKDNKIYYSVKIFRSIKS